MKYCLFIICLTTLVHLLAVSGKSCQKSDHCHSNECCMTLTSMVGSCRSMGCEGCSCQPENAKSHIGDMYLMSCPCLEGLECVSQVLHKEGSDETEYINSTCQKHEDIKIPIKAQERPKILRALTNGSFLKYG
ncbi:uncharacterized protein [Parasteatoda tepidariorum]|uniref:uncharacterized protein n=1 Tax=Parasteatoda tepidariorum TaxID=114398 RepID=UPI001C724047|nr:uncharacterized protein LOC107447819 [Parasteatoda tepidariorum]